MNQQYTPEQLQMMRDILAQNEGTNHVGMKEFDLNNPPKQPYFYQELPRMVYHHSKRKTQIAHHEADLAAALEAGWTKEPFPAERVEDELDAADLAEVQKADAIAQKKRK